MTSEICMMNRLAVVLAADSASTVSRWINGKKEERYFKGANKIFQLSNKHPVGLMIFDSADVLSVPWETIIKSFRENLGNKSFNTVDDYANEMFSYLNENNRFFPEDVQNDYLLRAAKGVAWSWLTQFSTSQRETGQSISDFIEIKMIEIENIDQLDCVKDDITQNISKEIYTDLEIYVQSLIDYFQIIDVPSDLNIPEKCIIHVIKDPHSYFDNTGLVFAGYGDHEFFPSCAEYKHCGVISGQHMYKRVSFEKIDHNRPASTSAFAQTSMIDTFSMGLSSDVFSTLMVAVHENIAVLSQEIVTTILGENAAIDGIDSLVQATAAKISTAVLDNASNEHSLPLRSVLSVLPVDEMAELAETLITLQSLKEKVTKPSETVGGPVDVAIITKHEGLVWVKRKHFFSPEINSRYKLRQAAIHS